MFLNYPNNPTAAMAGGFFRERRLRLLKKIILLSAMMPHIPKLYFDGKKPMSFLEIDGARDVGIEFHSLSKTYNMTGWRIGFAVGNRDIISGLGKIKTNLDSGSFRQSRKPVLQR